MNQSPSLSVILPCYNPGDIWMQIVEKNLQLLAGLVTDMELIVVNDGSTKNFDNHQVKDFFNRYPQVKIISYSQNRGKGHALRTGVMQSRGSLVIYTDIDFPYTNESLFKILEQLNSGNADLAVGIRPDDYYTHLPEARVRISKFLKFLIRKFLRIPTDDTQCGLKGFNEKGKEIFLQTTIDRYLFDLEFIFLAAGKGLRISAASVELRPEVQLSTMKWRTLLQESGNFIKIFFQSII